MPRPPVMTGLCPIFRDCHDGGGIFGGYQGGAFPANPGVRPRLPSQGPVRYPSTRCHPRALAPSPRSISDVPPPPRAGLTSVQARLGCTELGETQVNVCSDRNAGIYKLTFELLLYTRIYVASGEYKHVTIDASRSDQCCVGMCTHCVDMSREFSVHSARAVA